jgi:hypothetical protein
MHSGKSARLKSTRLRHRPEVFNEVVVGKRFLLAAKASDWGGKKEDKANCEERYHKLDSEAHRHIEFRGGPFLTRGFTFVRGIKSI